MRDTLSRVERLVLVHGSVENGDSSWRAQARLRDRYELVILNRPGFPPGPPEVRVDFEEHAAWVVERLEPGDHLCGHSYGAVVSLYAAAGFGELRSLTVVEPPAFGIAAHDPEVAALVEESDRLWASGPPEPRAFLAAFYALIAGRPIELQDPLPPAVEQGARALMVERRPWEAEPPLPALAAAPYPKLVVSGGWSPAFDAVCDVLERELDAERAVIPGAGHGVQRAPGFNARLLEFLRGA